jgi:predicted XRE-type DNA-binding protein
MTNKKIEYEEGSGNVFADLGLENSEELLVKAELTRQISNLILSRGLTQEQASKLLGTSQSKISDLIRGKLSSFSLERLIIMLKVLGEDVAIVIKEKPKSRAHAHFTVRTA